MQNTSEHLNLNVYNFKLFIIKLIWIELINLNFTNVNFNFSKWLEIMEYQNNFNKNTQIRNFTYFSYLESFDSTTATILNNTTFLNIWLPNTLTIKELEKFDKQILNNMDKLIRSQVQKKASYFYYLPELYEFWDFVPFTQNLRFEKQIYRYNNLDNYYSISYHWVTSDLKSFYFEPFYFFWKKVSQSMDVYRLVCFFWQRTLLLEEWIYPNPETKKDKPIFQPLAQFFHKSELKSGLKILRWINNYKDYAVYPYYLWFDDFQEFAIDKNFLHIWNYWIGASHHSNIYASKYFVGDLNILREKIFTPKTHANSKIIRKDLSYKNYNHRLINFTFFPDMAMMWGHLNPAFDKMTLNYNWFFHSGDNFMDSCLSLKFIWYHLTYNLWGPFEYLAVDYSWFQPTYFADQMASIRVPMILLICKNYLNSKQMNIFVKDYDAAFQFKRFKKFKKITGEDLFYLSKLSRLELFRDPINIVSKMHPFEWIVNLFYGYNSSECNRNYPSWYSDITNSLNFYASLSYNYDEDKFQEERFKQIVRLFSSEKNDFVGNISIYFNKLTPQFPFKTFFYFINEKLFDDIGYIYTSRNRGNIFTGISNLNWLENLSIIHFEVLPTPHYSWWLTLLNNFVLEWSLISLPDYFKKLSELYYEYNTFFKLNLKRTGIGLVPTYEKKIDLTITRILPYPFPNSFGFDLNLIYLNWLTSLFFNNFSKNFTLYYNKFLLNFDSNVTSFYQISKNLFDNCNSSLYTYFIDNLIRYFEISNNQKLLLTQIFELAKFNFFKILFTLYITSLTSIYVPLNFFIYKSSTLSFIFNFYFINKITDSINLNKNNNKDINLFLILNLLTSISIVFEELQPKFNFFRILLLDNKIEIENLIFWNLYILFIYAPVGFFWNWIIRPFLLETNSFLPNLLVDMNKYVDIFFENEVTVYFFKSILRVIIMPHKNALIKVYFLKGTPYVVTSISFYDLKLDLPQFYFFIPFFHIFTSVQTIKFLNNKTNALPFYLRNFFLNIKTDEDYYWFVLLLTVYELNRSIHIDSNLQKLVPIINSIDSKNLKLSTLEYQRYKNYVIKHKTYKRF